MAHKLLNPTSNLFARSAAVQPGERALLLHSDDPGLARWLVEAVGADGQVWALHTSHRALNLLARVPGLDLSDAVYPDPDTHGPADVALLDVPKGREHVRAYLWTAAQTLRSGGQLYLAGSNAGGAKSAIKDAAALFGGAPVLGYKSSRRIALGTRPDVLSVPAEWDDTLLWEPQTRTIARPGGAFTVVTMPGVFSWDHLDDGTALLLDHLDITPGEDVLDLGCGTGMIGLAAGRAGARVTLVDDDLLAVRCARESAAINGLADHCEALPSDVTAAIRDRQFDRVLSNPPFHQSIEVTTGITERFIRESFDVLRRGGRLRIVANRFLPYDRVMRDVFGSVGAIAETGRYFVLESERR
jgi:16S rRNA (guanine1207-N2)-methyltransferase